MSPQNRSPRQFPAPPRLLVLALFAVVGLLWGNHLANEKRTIQPPARPSTAASPSVATQP